MPDPTYWYRIGNPGMKARNRSAETAQVRVLTPHLRGQRDEERAYQAYAATCVHDALTPATPRPYRNPHAIALERCGSRLGTPGLKVSVLLDPAWVARARERHGPDAACELRRNGRAIARARLDRISPDGSQVLAELRVPIVGDVLYSVHDVFSGEALAGLVSPASRRARRVVGTVENRPRPEVRGWVLDPGNPDRGRKVAIHVNGRLRRVVDADQRRADIARWKGSDGCHGFLWRIPEDLAGEHGARIDVLDAETGRPLRGSPVRIEGRRVARSEGHGT